MAFIHSVPAMLATIFQTALNHPQAAIHHSALRRYIGYLILLPATKALPAGLIIAWILHRIQGRRFHPLKWLSAVPRNPAIAMAILMAISIGGRLAYLPIYAAPQPQFHDEFSYLLAAETFAHGRLTNPTPEFWTHFETYHELMVPTYMAKYPPAPALFLALGEVAFGSAFAGVLLSCALMCAALYWTLAGMMPHRWAFLGALLAAVQISWTSYWDSSYYGGAVAAIGGCLLVGAAARLKRQLTARNGAVLAAGLCLLALTRPYEGLLLALPVCCYVLFWIFRMRPKRHLAASLTAFVLVFAAGMSWMLYYNWRITGHAGVLPYAEFARQYGSTPALVFEKLGKPANSVVSTQKNQYLAFELPDYVKEHTLHGFLSNSLQRLEMIWLFFVGPALTLVLPGFACCAKNPKLCWLWMTLGFMLLGWEVEVWIQTRYYAPALPVIMALLIFAMRALYAWRRTKHSGAIAVTGCLLALAIAFGLPLVLIAAKRSTGRQTMDAAEGRSFISKTSVTGVLNAMPGNDLVLVHYAPEHNPSVEWVYNGYDIPSQKIIWAHDLDPDDPNQPLICHYRDRHVWRLEPVDTEAWTPEQARKALKPIDTAQACGAGNAPAAQ